MSPGPSWLCQITIFQGFQLLDHRSNSTEILRGAKGCTCTKRSDQGWLTAWPRRLVGSSSSQSSPCVVDDAGPDASSKLYPHISYTAQSHKVRLDAGAIASTPCTAVSTCTGVSASGLADVPSNPSMRSNHLSLQSRSSMDGLMALLSLTWRICQTK